MIVFIVLITTVGKVLSDRSQRVQPRGGTPKLAPGETEDIRQALDDLSGRVIRLEEERDFYKELLDAPARQREIPPPDDSSGNA